MQTCAFTLRSVSMQMAPELASRQLYSLQQLLVTLVIVCQLFVLSDHSANSYVHRDSLKWAFKELQLGNN